MASTHLAHRSVVLVGGWLLVGMAIAVIIRIEFGAAPYDVLNVGVGTLLGVAPGTALWLTGAGLVAAAWCLGERLGVGTPLGFLAIGHVINVMLDVTPEMDSLMVRVLMLPVVLAGLYLGVCLIVVSRLGAGPTEVFMLALVRRGVNLRVSRWLIDGGCAVLGIVAGGPIGVLTVIIVVAGAPTISLLLGPVGRMVHLSGRDGTASGAVPGA